MITDIPTYLSWLKMKIELTLSSIFRDDGRRFEGDYHNGL